MSDKRPENKEENPLKELENIKLMSFEELEHQCFNDIKLEDFQKEHLKEFEDVELTEFKEFVEASKTGESIENLKIELNSKDALKNIIKELQDIGINGKLHINLLKRLKREVQK